MASLSSSSSLSDYQHPINFYGFARNFALLFHTLKKEYIPAESIANVYAQHFKKSLSMKKDFNASSTYQMLAEKLPIFHFGGPSRKMVKLDKKKLVDFLFIPVLKAQNGKLKSGVVPKKFKDVTKISSDFLLEIFDWHKFQDVATLVCKISPASFFLDINQDLVLLSSIRPKSASTASTTESKSKKKQTNSSQQPTEIQIQPQVFPHETPTQGIPQHPADSQQLKQSKMSSVPPRPTPTSKVTLLPNPIASVGPPHCYPNLAQTAMRPPMQVPPGHVIGTPGGHTTPPFSHHVQFPGRPSPIPPAVDLTGDNEKSLDSRQHPLKGINKFPNPQTEISNETLLPSHEQFRPELSQPSIKAGALSIVSKKKSTKKQDPLEAINSKLEEIVEDLSSKGKFVPVNYVRTIMHDIIRQQNGRIHWRQVKFMENYSKVHGRVEELIKMFCLFNPITTLYELEQALVLTENVQSFEELHMGPLLKHPKVKDFFKPPEDLEEIPKITGFKLRRYLMDFLSKRNRTKKKSSLEEFLEFVQVKEFAESVYHLCIKITSFPLAIQMVFKYYNSQRDSKRRADQELESEMLKLVQHETERLKRKLSFQSLSEESILREVARKNPVEILTAVFNACQKYFTGPVKRRVDDFMMTFTGNPRLQNLLLLAIYEGAYEAEKHMIELFGENRSQDGNPGASFNLEIYHTPRSEVLKEVTSQLTRIPFPVDLASLARVEAYLAEKFNAPNFDALGNGSFLNFLASCSELISALGGGQIGASSSSGHSKALRRRLLGLVRQLAIEHKEEGTVARLICAHFNVESFQDLGCGTVSKLIADAQLASHQQFPIKYIDPLLSSETSSTQPQVGLLGHQTDSDALSCLKKAPLLEDLKEWSHWDLLYRPQFGEIESFLESHPDVCALQVAPGKLLRVDPDSIVKDFIHALELTDPIRASGHLVSLVVQRGGVKNVSPQLLASHVTSSLEKMLASSDESSSLVAKATKFIHDCLVRIPLKMCINIANEIFLEPLRQVATSSSVSDILTHCRCLEHRWFFQSLGMAIGIKHWADDFGAMLEEVNEQVSYLSSSEQQSLTKNEGLCMASSEGKPLLHTDPTPMEQSWFTVDPAENEDSADNELGVPPDVMETTEGKEAYQEHCRGIIESIRHDNFGVGVKLDKQQQEVAEKQREREGRGLQRLSSELYTKDTHFVLELIQNADDNSYPSRGVTPSLVFVVSETAITVLNNEVGFLEKNIRAICDVGKSTKGAHRSGYIGQKGIGFKSVFRVSNTPEIHSKGFHIRFDASADPIGFILPNWIKEAPAGEINHKWTTRVILPLKVDHLSTNMVKKFNDIQPSLLLFLHRLRSISIEDQVTGNVRQMVRSDKEHGVIEIRHEIRHMDMDISTDGSIDRWLVVRRILDKAKQFKQDVEATELAIAFPLPPSVSDIPLSKDLHHQQVFAFLPLRSYGFRFILQGDFDLPSSREDVNSDSPWNQWLREEVPSLFLESLQRIMELRGISEMDAVSLFLQFVPLEGELHDFFQPVTRQILNLLRGRDCLPSDPFSHNTTASYLLSSGSEEEEISATVSWRQPSQFLIIKEKFSFIRDNIQQTLLSQSLNLLYLNSSVLPYVNPTLQNQLGIASISLEHLKEVAETALDIYLRARQEGSPNLDSGSEEEFDSDDLDFIPPKKKQSLHQMFVKWVANWLACVHLIIEDTSDISVITAMESLKKLKILPLENGSLASTEGSALFFPPDFNRGKESKVSAEYQAILAELQVIDVKLFEEGDELVQSRVRKVLEQLGVKSLYPADIIRHHITPVFINSTYKTKKKPQRLLLSYLLYIKECIEDRRSGVTEPEVVQLLRDNVVLITNRGLKAPSKEVIHFSSPYKCDPDLQSLFPNVKWTVVESVYLKKSVKKEDIHFWLRFFVKLGVKRGLHVRRSDEHLPEDSTRLEELRNILYRRMPAGACTVRDWQSEEFREVINSVKNEDPNTQSQQMSSLAKLLDQNWNEEYAKYMDAKIYDGQNENYLDINDASTFKRDIVQLAWLPCSHINPNTDTVLFRGKELFNGQARQLISLLSNHVPYLGVELKSSDLLSLLAIRTSVSVDELVEYLQQWAMCSRDEPFVTSVDHMRSVYLHLHHVMEEGDIEDTSSSRIQELFQEERVIFVPNKYEEFEAVPGSFYTVHSVCWVDPSTVLYYKQKNNRELPPTMPKLLQLYYNTKDQSKNLRIQQAFKFFGVPNSPLTNTYISLLKHVSSLSPTPEPLSVKDFTSIAFCILDIMDNNPSVTSSYIYNNLKQARVFPTHSGHWVSLEECLLENDSSKVAKCFRETEDIHFLQWPTKDSHKADRHSTKQISESQQRFTNLCQIPKLSIKAVERITNYGMTIPEDTIKGYLHMWVPLIQQYLTTQCPQTYKRLQDEEMRQVCERLVCFSVGALDCRYSIEHGGKYIESSQSTALACTFTNKLYEVPTLYILKSKVERLGSLLPGLEKMFKAENSPKEEVELLKEFLQNLINQQPSTVEEIEEVANNYNLPQLPEGEPVWNVPIARYQQVEEESSEESSSDENEGVETWPNIEQEKEAESNQDVGLKSWPPRAAVEREDGYRTHHPSNSAQQQETSQTVDKTKDTVGRKEYEDIKNKFSLEGEAPPVGELRSTSSSATLPEDKHAKQTVEKKHGQLGDKSSQDHTVSTQATGTSPMSPPPSKPHHGHAAPSDISLARREPEAESSMNDVTRSNSSRGGGHSDKEVKPTHGHRGFFQEHISDSQVGLVPLTELVLSASGTPLISFLDSDDPDYLLKVGRWGEEFVFTLLKNSRQFPDGGGQIVTITWVNESSESGLPYDLKLEVDTNGAKERQNYFIDVKATANQQKEMVAASWKELKFAEDHSDSYYIYRVYGAGSSTTRVSYVKNLVSYFDKNQTRLIFYL